MELSRRPARRAAGRGAAELAPAEPADPPPPPPAPAPGPRRRSAAHGRRRPQARAFPGRRHPRSPALACSRRGRRTRRPGRTAWTAVRPALTALGPRRPFRLRAGGPTSAAEPNFFPAPSRGAEMPQELTRGESSKPIK
eukprot:TRINITY_DN8016_c0_g1_i6.p2 TRINITY_DN8016_c0_g1~~TRINITY_DN8016_c0_g1_i6.p2  ORF type:complete len:162 (+),score=4.89 TRINITY_DN8016_c0_g1_i6:71-487(+)